MVQDSAQFVECNNLGIFDIVQNPCRNQIVPCASANARIGKSVSVIEDFVDCLNRHQQFLEDGRAGAAQVMARPVFGFRSLLDLFCDPVPVVELAPVSVWKHERIVIAF